MGQDHKLQHMKSIHIIFLLGTLGSIFSCNNQGSDPMMSKIVGKTYFEIRDIVFSQAEGEAIEWHGEALAQLPSDSVKVAIAQDESCGQQNCDGAVALHNLTSSKVEVVFQITHGINDIYPYFSRKVTLAGNKTIAIGCQRFCYEDGETELNYNIVGSKIISN